MAQKGRGSKSQEKKQTTEVRRGRKSQSNKPETGIERRQPEANLRTVSPFSLMRRFSEELDRLFGDFSFGGGLNSGFGREFSRFADLEGSMWLPQVESFEREGKLVVRADLPGLTRDDINVDIADDAIKIRGERRQENEENEEGYYRSERSYGSFYREIPLPGGVNPEEAKASFNNGVLEITMPAPARQSGSRRIEIGEGSEVEQRPKAMGKGAGK
ncbi:MAG TPA: Hsp20/alpha crystallin family protein [Pyrinomonadaceae bacterium]|nr:Hsp20/alpha crystallin family protein [Pyrinomonadaceae bacterium]